MQDRRPPSLVSRMVWRLLRALYHWRGYTLVNHPPKLPKFILVGAPHTSNWDFVYFAGAVQEVGIQPGFIGKHTLFTWPMTRFMYDMGGLPINRSAPGGYVNSVVKHINAANEIALVIAAEGSRTSDGRWRSGFYHIAKEAGIPIVPAWLDAPNRRAGFGDPIMPSGDFLADLGQIAAFYQRQMPDCARFDVLAAQARGEVPSPGKQRE